MAQHILHKQWPSHHTHSTTDTSYVLTANSGCSARSSESYALRLWDRFQGVPQSFSVPPISHCSVESHNANYTTSVPRLILHFIECREAGSLHSNSAALPSFFWGGGTHDSRISVDFVQQQGQFQFPAPVIKL